MGAKFVIFSLAAALLAACAAAPIEPADTVFWGGPIYTARDDAPMAEAVAVTDGRVAFVGARARARAYVGLETEVVDLAGAAMYPGFTDSHAHLFGIGQRERTLNLEGVASIAELKARVTAALQHGEVGEHPGDALVGRGWIETHWPEGRFPTAADLDEVAPNVPVVLVRADGHALVANHAAMLNVWVNDSYRPPEGGEALRDDDGRLTGMFVDNAMERFAAYLSGPMGDARLPILREGAEVYAAYGWTGLHNMSVEAVDVEGLETLARDGDLPVRVYNAVVPEAWRLLGEGPREAGDGRAVTRAVKLYMDGALGSRGAALLEPYSDAPDSRGLDLMTADEAAPQFDKALRDGVQLCVHAIGDRGNRTLLDWIEAAYARTSEDERAIAAPRWRSEHSQIVDPVDIPRFAALGVIPSMQPSHAIGDLHFAPARLGLDRLAGTYAWRSFIDAGSIVPGGSDAPVERGDPLIEFYAAVARKDLEGFSGEGWHPEQAVSRTEALKMFTAWPAYASFREDELGTIAPGMRADFSVFSGDLMTVPEAEIPHLHAVMTVVDGAIVHRAE